MEYRIMKSSGIEWVGEIPEDWNIHPVGYYFSERKNKNSRGLEKNLLSLSYGKVIRKDINTNGGLLPASFNTYNIVEADDIIIRPTDLQNDKRSLRTGIAREHGIITSAYIALKAKRTVISPYFHYLLHSYDIAKVFYNMGNGVRQGLNFSEFAKLMVIEPPIPEQKSIATFLDSKCSEIDALISDIQSQIDILEQYKRSVITEAITKGLNPDVETKDSGVEWIGLIPKHWSCCKQKYLISLINGRAYKDTEFEESGKYPVLRVGNLFTNPTWYYSNLELPADKYCEAGDLLYSWSMSYAPIIWQGEKVIYHYHIWKTALNQKLDKGFAFYYLTALTEAIKAEIHETTMGFITMGVMNNSYIAYPDLSEQKEIADYLDTKCAEIDLAISEKKAQLKTLADYKKSLIFEYVTGKKQVKEEA